MDLSMAKSFTWRRGCCMKFRAIIIVYMNLLKTFQSFSKQLAKTIPIDAKMLYAHYLPKEWDSQKVKQVLGKSVEEVTLVRDRLSRPTGRALIKVKSE